MKISKNGIKMIKKFEGCSLYPYLCSAGVPTIGYGNTTYLDGKKVSLSDPKISEEQAENLLKMSLQQYGIYLEVMVQRHLTQNQFDALTSFIFNVGITAFKNSTLFKKLNEGDYLGAADEFLKWNKANGKVLEGLVKRRAEERKLFLKD